MAAMKDEEGLLRSVALQNASAILLARQRAEEELERTKEALRESQERLTAALSAAGTGTFRWNLQTNRVEWDGNLDRLFGLNPGRATPTLNSFVTAMHPDDRPAVLAAGERSARDGSDFDLEFRVLWRDGSEHWIRIQAKPFFDDAGKPLYMTGACADITTSKQAAEALRENEERLRAIFNQAAVGIAIATLEGQFLDMNAKFSQILGYSGDELRGLTLAAITHPDDLSNTSIAMRQLLDGAIAEYSLEKRYVRKDASVVWSLSTVTLLKDAKGEPQRIIGVIEDITARKQAESALQEETRVLELLNETGKAVASQLDLQPLVQAATDAATTLSGAEFGAFFYNASDAEGDAFELYTLSGAPRSAFATFGKPRATAVFGPTFRGAPAVRIADVLSDPRHGTMSPHYGMPIGHLPVRSYLAVAVKSRSGEVIGGLFFGHSQPNMFTDRAERLIVGVAAQTGIAIDNARLYEAAQQAAAERKALLESERAARAEAERMSAIKDEFLATLSHELRTPLNAILGWAHMLQSESPDRVDLVKGLQTIERNARAQTLLIDDLLDMSRITSGKLRLEIQTVQPASFIEAAVETVRPAADAKSIRLELSLDPGAGPIAADAGRMQQVVWNILSNAIKFTPSDGAVRIQLARAATHIELRVSDTGVGISPGFMPHLFERFRQGDASSSRRYSGLGLGLSIVKSLVELHGGTVAVTSTGEGQGTTVTVKLPLSRQVR
jgi:PAS domain S-box-containing protein